MPDAAGNIRGIALTGKAGETLERIREREAQGRCSACGQFLRKDSEYMNRCPDCWTPEDDFLY